MAPEPPSFEFDEGKLREIPIVRQVLQHHIRDKRKHKAAVIRAEQRIATRCDILLGTLKARTRRRTTMADIKAPVERPLSPHLFIYKPMLTMMMSIVHRITGGALYFGTLLIAWWLLAAASSPNAYAGIGSFMSSFFGRIILFGYTWALMHHMLGGIRHFIWDTGHGFGPHEREWLAVASLVGSISLTIVIWVVGYLFMGGPR
jgi:succinate dehydrogenase / fumarate reductase cytochrome b subunit